MADELTARRWLERLSRRLESRRAAYALREAYYDGDHRLLFQTSKFREAFGDLFGAFADNWCSIVVDVAVERLAVEGFRFGPQDAGADDLAWTIWQANSLDAQIAELFTDMGVCGEAAMLVEPRPGQPAQITIEHPAETIVATSPANPLERVAALKQWVDEDTGATFANVYLPTVVWKFRREAAPQASTTAGSKIWTPPRRELATGPIWALREAQATPNPIGLVPMVPFLNRPVRRGGERRGVSDLATVIPLQDFVNKVLADAVIASEYAAYPQRWATGIEAQFDEATGDELPPQEFVAAISRLWTEGNENAKFGTFEAADISKYVSLVEMAVQHIAAQSRTPPHYLLGQAGQFPSGESLKATETGLAAKARRKHLDAGEPLEETMRLAFLAQGDERRGRELRAETIWRDPESRTEGERVDALVKMATLGVPRRALWERWGVSQTEANRWEAMAARDAREALTAGLGGVDPYGANPEPETGGGDVEEARAIKARVDAATALYRAGYDPQAALSAAGLDPIEHSGLLPVTLQGEG